MRVAYVDLEQAESRVVGAICLRLFGDSTYLDAVEAGDIHSYVARMNKPELPWPAEFDLAWLKANGLKQYPSAVLAAAKKISEGTILYRDRSLRFCMKPLGHGCLTADHEVLTPSGWVTISSKPSRIMQKNGSFADVRQWTDKEYSGPMIEWEGQAISVCMTADHRVYYKIDSSGTNVKSADTVPASAAIMLSGESYFGGHIGEPLARLLAAYHCDGWHDGYNSVKFHFHKQRKKDRIKQLAADCGIAWKEHADSIRLMWKPELHEPSWSMLMWTAQSLNAYTDELPNWDGHKGKTSTALFSKNKEWLEKWQTFNRLLGYGGNIQKPHISGFGTVMYKLQVNNRTWASRQSFTTDRRFETTVHVYCPTVPDAAFYIRRNGKISVTGNSNYLGQPNTMAKHSHLPIPLIEHFQSVYFDPVVGFHCIKRWHEHVRETIQTRRELTTMLGRRIFVLKDPLAASTLREMVAFEPQSVGTGDYMNAGMMLLDEKNLPLHLLKQVHDALAFEYDRRDEDWLIPEVCSTLSWSFPLTPEPNRFTALAQKRKHTSREEEDFSRLTALLENPRPFSIPVEPMVGWNLAKRDKGDNPKNPNGLIVWKEGKPDQRQRITPPAITNAERFSAAFSSNT